MQKKTNNKQETPLKQRTILLFLTLFYVLILLLVFLFGLYQQIRMEGFANISKSTHLVLNKEYDVNLKQYILKGSFTSPEDQLGTIYFNLNTNNISSEDEIVLRIKQLNQTGWHSSNNFNINSFNLLKPFPFGIKPIESAKNTLFIIQIESSSVDLSKSEIFPLGESQITTRHVFSSNQLINNKKLLLDVAINKATNTLSNQLYVLIIIACTFPLSFIVARRMIKTKRNKLSLFNMSKTLDQITHDLIKININIFYISALLFFSILVLLLFKQESLAIRFSHLLFLSLVLALLQNFLSPLLTFIKKIKPILNKITQKHIILFFLLSITLLSINSTYTLGGDDTRLFYRYPTDYFNNFVTKVGSDIGISDLRSVLPPISIAPFTLLLIGLKSLLPFLNLQSFLYYLNFFLAGLFFYKLIMNLIPNTSQNRFISITIALMYVSSMFNIYALYSAKLLSNYLLSIVPFSLYFLIRSLEEKKFYLLIPVALIWTLFSVLSVSLPWMLGILLTISPMFIWLIIRYKLQVIKYALLFLVISILLNINWIFFAPYSAIIQNETQARGSSISSNEFRQENAEGIKSVSQINNLAYPLLNSYHYKIQSDFDWPNLDLYKSWYLPLLPLNALLLIFILIAAKKKITPQYPIYIVGSISLLLSLYLFTVNINGWGIPLFTWLNNYIPGFVIFRNMYDKFGHAMAFTYAFITAISISIIIHQNRFKRLIGLILGITFVIVLLNAKPFLTQEYDKKPIWTTENTYPSITDFNQDYWDLVQFIKDSPETGRYLALPLNHGNLFLIQDKSNENHYYVGVSPLLILTGKNDYSGILSFGGYGRQIKEDIKEQNYQNLLNTFKKLNVTYVIVNNSISKDLIDSYLFSDGLIQDQNDLFFTSILGQKVKDFGSRYSLYKINPSFENNKVSLINESTTPIQVTKEDGHQYSIHISNLKNGDLITFAEPFNSNWMLVSSNGTVISNSEHTTYNNFSNSWKLNVQELKQQLNSYEYSVNDDSSINIDLKILFKPFHYFYLVNSIVTITFVVLLAYFIFAVIKDHKKTT